MRKTITPVIAVVLLTLMTVGASVLAFFWVTSVQSSAQEQVGSSIEGAPGTGKTRLNIISMRGDGVTVQNVGLNNVESITLIIDGMLEEYDLPNPLNPGSATIVSFSQVLQKDTAHTVSVVSDGVVTSSQSVNAKEASEEAGYGEGSQEPQTCGEDALFKPSSLIIPTGPIEFNTHSYGGHNYSVSGIKYVCRVDFMLTSTTGAGDVNVYITENDPSQAGFNALSLTPDNSVSVTAGQRATYSVLLNKPVTGEFFVLLNADNSTATTIKISGLMNTANTYDREMYYCSDTLGVPPPGGCSAGDGLWTVDDFIGAGFLTSELALNMIVHVDDDGTCDDLCSLNNYCSTGICSSWDVLCTTDCDGTCPSVDCYGVDPDCNSTGGLQECCGNSVCGVGEGCSSCVNDCTCTWPNDTCCDDNCVNINENESYCGDCFTSCNSTSYCDFGNCVECGSIDGNCVASECYGIDPECTDTGGVQEVCGNGYCNITAGEDLTTCAADCHKYITSFSDNSYYGILSYAGGGTDTSKSLKVPKNATASKATISIRGEPATEKYGFMSFINTTNGRSDEVQLIGDYLFMTENNMKYTGFLVYDVSDKSNPSLVENYSNFNYSYGMHIVDDVMYVGGDSYSPGGPKFWVIDVSDPVNPVELASKSVLIGDVDVWAVHGVEDYAYSIDYAYIYASNVTDKSTIQNVDSINLGGGNKEIQVEGDYAYVMGEVELLNIVDISDPTSMSVVYTNSSSYSAVQGSHNMFVENGIVYITAGQKGLTIINATTPSSAYHLSHVPGYYYDVHKSGDYVYLAAQYPNDDLRIVDVSDLANPVLLDYSRGLTRNSVESVYVNGDYIYAGVYTGLDIINKNGRTISKAGESTLFTDARGIHVMEDYAYVSCNNDPDVRVFDVSTKSNPVSYSNLTINGVGSSLFLLDESTGYTTGNYVTAINISNPGSPTVIDNSDKGVNTGNLMVVGDFAYTDELGIFSTENKNNIMNVSKISIDDATGIYVQGDYAYFPQYFSGRSMHVIDISDKYNPKNETVISFGMDVNEVFLRGDYAFLPGSRLQVVDISNPSNPSITSSIYDDGEDIYVLGNLAFQVRADNLLSVFDVSDSAHPTPIIHLTLDTILSGSVNLHHVFVQGDYAYVSDCCDNVGLITVYLGDLTYPNNPSIDLGSDNDYKWSYTNGENYGWRTIDVTDDLNDAISDCTPDGNGYCTITVEVSASSGSGSIYLENPFVSYNES